MNSSEFDDIRGLIEEMENTVETERATPGRVAVRTGLFSLDLRLGGGFPSGLVEIFGEPSSGKTALLGQTIAHTQRSGIPVAMWPTEHLDHEYLMNLGVDLSQLPIVNRRSAECFLVDFNPSLVVMDALAWFAEGPPTDMWIQHVQDMLSAFLAVMRPGSCFVMTNHVRARRSVDPRKTFAGGTTSLAKRITGMFSTRLEISRKDVSETKYTQTVNIVANILAPPTQYVEMESTKGFGVDRHLDLLRTAEELGAIQRHGAYFILDELMLGQGREEAVSTLQEDPEIELRLMAKVLQAVT